MPLVVARGEGDSRPWVVGHVFRPHSWLLRDLDAARQTALYDGMTQNEPEIRLAAFVGVFLAMGIWESLWPRRRLVANKPARWFSNLSLAAINAAAIRLALALGAVGIAAEVQSRQWGLFNNVPLPAWLTVVLSVLLLDLAIYFQHVLFHAVPLLWRLHMVHHADPDFDATTGLRFHTIEIALSMGLKAATIMLIGPPPVAVLAFEMLLNATSIFNHSNATMPTWLDRRAAFASRHSRHAPRSPLDSAVRNQQQLWIQLALVGLPIWHVSSPAGRGARSDGNRTKANRLQAGGLASLDARPAVCGQRGLLSD